MSTKIIAALGTTALLSLAAGAAGGYFFAKDKLGKEFDERLKTEVAEAKKFYSKLHKRDENDIPQIVETPQSLPIERDAIQAMQRYQGHGSDTSMDPVETAEPESYQTATDHTGEKVVDNNVFDNQPDLTVEAYENLIKDRDRDSPYIITLAEYMNNETGYEQSALVYFEGDGILVDDRDEIVDDPDNLVGNDNLVKFGHFSGDPRAVYVRNDTIQHDLEIVKHEGKYSYVVLGLQPDIDSVEV